MKIIDTPFVTKIEMTKRVFKKWLKALRSKQYKKATGSLTNKQGTGFCCLGVLANEQGCLWQQKGGDVFLYPIFKDSEVANDSSSCLRDKYAFGLPEKLQSQLASFNDRRVDGWVVGKSVHNHRDIANWLEKNITPTG
jgi:hypothetical protein